MASRRPWVLSLRCGRTGSEVRNEDVRREAQEASLFAIYEKQKRKFVVDLS